MRLLTKTGAVIGCHFRPRWPHPQGRSNHRCGDGGCASSRQSCTQEPTPAGIRRLTLPACQPAPMFGEHLLINITRRLHFTPCLASACECLTVLWATGAPLFKPARILAGCAPCIEATQPRMRFPVQRGAINSVVVGSHVRSHLVPGLWRIHLDSCRRHPNGGSAAAFSLKTDEHALSRNCFTTGPCHAGSAACSTRAPDGFPARPCAAKCHDTAPTLFVERPHSARRRTTDVAAAAICP